MNPPKQHYKNRILAALPKDEISRLARHLDRLRANAFSAHDLEAWEFDVLAALRRSGPLYRLSPGQLLRETLVTSGTMTNRVDRLTDRGLLLWRHARCSGRESSRGGVSDGTTRRAERRRRRTGSVHAGRH